MPISNGIFYEYQRDGLCRLHSLNGFFGESKISTEQFNIFSKKMDKYIEHKFHGKSNCLDFDSVSSDHNILVSFILKQYGIYPRYLPINSLFQNLRQLYKNIDDLNGNYFFVFNSNHIWGVRRVNNKWYKVDSLTGVDSLRIDGLSELQNIGFLFPIIPKVEFYKNIEIIKNIFKGSTLDTTCTLTKIKTYLGEINDKHLILGDLEVPLGISMDILNVVYKTPSESHPQFNPIEKIINQYDMFLLNFTPDKYHSKDLKILYLADLLFILIKLGKQNK